MYNLKPSAVHTHAEWTPEHDIVWIKIVKKTWWGCGLWL